MQNRISVITPVFNGAHYIDSCIRNVIDQACPDAEHLIIDGGSSDGTVEIVKRYAARHPHIRWVSEKDRGQSDAMNKGIALASAGVISFLNVDDYYEEGVLNWVADRFDRLPEPSLLVGNCNLWDGNGTLLDVNRPDHLKLTHLLVGDEYLFPFPINPSAYFYHKSLHDLTGLYQVDEHYAMDLVFILQAVKRANVVYVDRVLGNFRYLEGTKTFDDSRDGAGDLRYRSIIEKYRIELSLGDKAVVRVLTMLAPLLRRWKYAKQLFRQH